MACGCTDPYALDSRVNAAAITTNIKSEQAAWLRAASQLAALGREFYRRGWVLGTSGNFSLVISENPLRLAITASGFDKGSLEPAHILAVDGSGNIIAGPRSRKPNKGVPERQPIRPSDETKLHLAIVRSRGAGAVLHTHSVWATIISEKHAGAGGVSIEGYEMLKGLQGVRSHEHRAWLPILENSQDMAVLAHSVERMLTDHPAAHGFLLRGHGLYTWGDELRTAKRHVEILEFLLEVLGRTQGMN